MSIRSLAIFLHRLRTDELTPVGPVSDGATLARLVAEPPPALAALLAAHVEALLATWPGGASLQPRSIPASALWVAAALNNLIWAVQRPDPRLLTITLRLTEALPVADDLATALAYHSLLRHLARINPTEDWRPVVQRMLERCPLSSAWLPRRQQPLSSLLLDLLRQHPVQAALRDRWLILLPELTVAQRIVPLACATANAELGLLLDDLRVQGDEWHPLLLAFYEADCLLQRHGSREQPTWPLLRALLTSARTSRDPLQRRAAERTLVRYRALVALANDERLPRRYQHRAYDEQTWQLLGESMPRVRFTPVLQRR